MDRKETEIKGKEERERTRRIRERGRQMARIKPVPEREKEGIGGIIWGISAVVLGMIILVLLISVLFRVQRMDISGNQYCSEEQITSWIKEDKWSWNSLYDVWKYRKNESQLAPCFENVEVTLKSPWTLKIKVHEKNVVAYLVSDNQNVFFDKDGVVMKIGTDTLDGVTCIEGLEVSDIKEYKKLKAADEDIFGSLLDVTQTLKKCNLNPDRIVVEGNVLYLYSGNVCVSLGKDDYTVKINKAAAILPQLEGMTGTLHLERYSSSNTVIRFEKDALPGQDSAPVVEQPQEEQSQENDTTDESIYYDGTDYDGGDDDSYDDSYDDTYDDTYDDSYDDTYDDTYDNNDTYDDENY